MSPPTNGVCQILHPGNFRGVRAGGRAPTATPPRAVIRTFFGFPVSRTASFRSGRLVIFPYSPFFRVLLSPVYVQSASMSNRLHDMPLNNCMNIVASARSSLPHVQRLIETLLRHTALFLVPILVSVFVLHSLCPAALVFSSGGWCTHCLGCSRGVTAC